MEVDAVLGGGIDIDRLTALLARALADAGLREPDVTVRTVHSLERHQETGKLRRFVPYR